MSMSIYKKNIKAFVGLWVFSICSVNLYAGSFQPNENTVLLKVTKIDLAKKYREKVNSNLNDINEVTRLTKEIIEKAKVGNDDLLYGKIEAVLIENKVLVENNEQLKLFLSKLLQHRHAFKAALNYLKNNDSVDANLTRAVILMNIGQYKKASNECKKLIGKSSLLLASTCLLHAESLQGKLVASYTSLKKVLNNTQEEDETLKIWAMTALADMANRLGNKKESLFYFSISNELAPNDAHIMSEWIDVLHNLNEQSMIQEILKNNHADIRLNLRYLRSLMLTQSYNHSLHHKNLKRLGESVMLMELRQDKRHYDTRAEYYTWINIDPEKAYFWAKKSWQVTRTPTAAKLLVLTSRSVNNNDVVKFVKNWVETKKIEDSFLLRLLSDNSYQDLMT